VEVATFGKILGNFSPIVPSSATGVRSRRFRRGDTWWRELERSNHWSSKLGVCKNLPAENTQRYLNRPKPTRVAVPFEEEEEPRGEIMEVLNGLTESIV